MSEQAPDIGVTTVEPAERRHLVQPYADRPVLEKRKGVVACSYCGHTGFRRSRLRFSDLTELLLMRYPVRCMRCSQRQFIDSLLALMAYAPKTTAIRPAQGSDTWKSWTGTSGEGQTVARPLTTAIGPRAQRLEQPAKPAAARPSAPPRVPSRRNDGIW